jgi:hypothetical protein
MVIAADAAAGVSPQVSLVTVSKIAESSNG